MTLPLSQGVQRAFWQQIQRGLSVPEGRRRRWNCRCATRVGCSGKLGVSSSPVPAARLPTASLLRGTRGDRRPRPVRGVQTGDRATPGQSAIDHHPRAWIGTVLAAMTVAERNWRDERARRGLDSIPIEPAWPSTTPSSGRTAEAAEAGHQSSAAERASRPSSSASTAPNRSPRSCARSSLRTRRCGCPTKPSTKRSSCKARACSSRRWRAGCARVGRCAASAPHYRRPTRSHPGDGERERTAGGG